MLSTLLDPGKIKPTIAKLQVVLVAAKQLLTSDSITTHTHSGIEINQMQPNCQNTSGTASFTTINRTNN